MKDFMFGFSYDKKIKSVGLFSVNGDGKTIDAASLKP